MLSQMAKGQNIRYHLLALAVVAVWGVTFVSTKVLIGAGMHPAAIFFIRFVLAYAGIWLYILLSGGDRRLWYGWKDELVFLILGATGGSLYFLTENTALAYTQACNVAFLVCSAPLFTALFTLLYRRFGRGRFADSLEDIRIGWPLVGGTVLALGGMALVVFDGARLQVSARGDLLEGVLLRTSHHPSLHGGLRGFLLRGHPLPDGRLGEHPIPRARGVPGVFHCLELRHGKARERHLDELRLP